MNCKAAILAGAAGMALMAVPAHAQDAQAEASAAAAENERDDADIIVTAQRRSERLQDVPLTVAVATEDMIQGANIDNATQIGKLVTGVVITSGNTTLMPFIRGVGTTQRAIGSESSIPSYIDGIYIPRLNLPMLRLTGISSIEVLKGPQGTLFGRNASGGLINIITKTPEPGSGFTGTAEVGYANYDTITVDGYAATGLGDKVGIDLAYTVYDQRTGWGYNRTRDTTVRKEQSLAIRSKLVFQPTETTRITVTGDYVNFDSDRGQQGHIYDFLQGYPAGHPLRGQALAPRGFYDHSTEVAPSTQVHGWGGSARIEHEMSAFTITNTASYQRNALEVFTDSDYSEATTSFFRNSELGESFINELLIQSNNGSGIKWTVGAFYGWLYSAYRPARSFGPALDGSLGAGNIRLGFSNQRIHTYAGFGQATIPLGNATNITLGGRLTHDNIVARAEEFLAIGGFPSDVPLVPRPAASRFGKTSYSHFGWRAAIDHHLDQDIMLYASASNGMKSVSFGLLFMVDEVPIEPEIVTAFEGGIKTLLFDRRLRFNVAGFYSKVRDLHQPLSVLEGGINITRVRNIPGLRSYGVDVELSASITQQFEVRAGYTYTNARYTDYQGASFFFYNPNPPYGNFPPVIGDATGNAGERAPPHTFNIGTSYTASVGSDGDELSLNANYAHTSSFFWNPDNQVRQRPYGLLDAQIKFTKRDPNVYLALWGSNLLNEKYYTEVQQTGSQVGSIGVPAAPRTYGVKVGYNF